MENKVWSVEQVLMIIDSVEKYKKQRQKDLQQCIDDIKELDALLIKLTPSI